MKSLKESLTTRLALKGKSGRQTRPRVFTQEKLQKNLDTTQVSVYLYMGTHMYTYMYNTLRINRLL